MKEATHTPFTMKKSNRVHLALILVAFCVSASFYVRAAETAQPSIPFNVQNKAVATKIYRLINDIQDSEFDPEANLEAITKLQEMVSQTEFFAIPELADYIRDSLSMNSIRSKDLKVDGGHNNKLETMDVSHRAGKGDIGFRTVSVGAAIEKTTTKKNNDDISNGVSISSTNEVASLDKVRQQQSTSYGRLLVVLKRFGFPRPIDPREVFGKWRWRCMEDEATYEFEFKQNGVVSVKLKADKPGLFEGHGFVNKGEGEWSIDYRAITLKLNAQNLAFFWKQRPLLFFKDREITSIDEDKIILAISEDNEMKRIRDSKR